MIRIAKLKDPDNKRRGRVVYTRIVLSLDEGSKLFHQPALPSGGVLGVDNTFGGGSIEFACGQKDGGRGCF
jgi:hypothetical protein